MKIPSLSVLILILAASQSHATVLSTSSGLFEHYAVSARDIVGSGYIRFYGPTNQDVNAIFTGWLIAGSRDDDPLLDKSYPAYDSIEALDLGREADAPEALQPPPANAGGEAYTLLLGYAIDPVCIGDPHSRVCADPGLDIPITLSTSISGLN